MVSLLVLDHSLWDLAQGQNLGSCLTELKEITALSQKYTLGSRLPELETLVSKNCGLTFLSDIQHMDIVGIYIDGLVTDY